MDDFDANDFNGVCRLFPLPGVVQFPHSVLPLHIFEPRYRQMTEDALASDGLITIVQLLPTDDSKPSGPRPIEQVACLGRILKHHRLPDGRFNILLQGLARVRLVEEMTSDRLYRLARAQILEESNDGIDLERSDELVVEFRAFLERASGGVDPEMELLLQSHLPLSVLTDIMGHALPFSVQRKQALLNESHAPIRANYVQFWLKELMQALPAASAHTKSRKFPPPFSSN